MIQISFWAKQHKNVARTILVLSQFMLFIIGVYFAILFDELHIHLDPSIALLSLFVMVAAWLLYPTKRQSGEEFKVHYYKRKCCELVVLWASLVLICFMFNKNERVSYLNTYQALNSSFISSKKSVKEVANSNAVSPKKALKKQFRELVKELKKSRRAGGGKGWLTALVILGGLALSFVVLGLSCNISCSGNETLGTIVLIGGIAVVILLMVLLIRSINRSKAGKDKEVNPLAAM